MGVVTAAGAALRAKLGVAGLTPLETAQARAALPRLAEAARQYSAGLERLALDDFAGGTALLERAIAVEPEYPLAHTRLAEALIWMGDVTRAHAEARRGLELSVGLGPEAQQVAEAALHLASGEPVEAVAIYRELFRRFPDEPTYGIELAANDVTPTAEALATLAALRRMPGPTPGPPRLDLIEAIVALRSDPSRALEVARRARAGAAARHSRLIEAMSLETEAAAHAELGQPEDELGAASAARAIYVAEKLDLKAARIDEMLAEVELVLGRIGEAAAQLEASLARDPNDAATASALAKVRFHAGDLDAAERLAEQAARELTEDHARPVERAEVAALLAAVALERGDAALAVARVQGARDLLVAPALDEMGERVRGAQLRVELANVLLHAGKDAEARKLVTEAQASGAPGRRIVELLRASSGDPADVAAARKTLAAMIGAAVESKNVPAQLQLRLVAGEIATRFGDAGAGVRELSELARDADARGFGLLSRQARRLAGAPR